MNKTYQNPMVTILQFAQADVCTVSAGATFEGTIDDKDLWSGF